MNWLRTILDGVIICIAFNGVVAFVWLLEPIGFSVMLPKGINTPLEKLMKTQIKPIRLMEFILYPILLAYIIISTYEAGIPAGLAASCQIYGPADGAGNRRQRVMENGAVDEEIWNC